MPDAVRRERTPLSLLWFAARFGLLYGAAEAVLSYGLSLVPGGLTWRNANSAPILAVAPLVYAVAFTAVSVPFAALVRLFPRFRWELILGAGLGFASGWLLAASTEVYFDSLARIMIGLGVAAATVRFLARRDPARILAHGLRRFLVPATAVGLLAALVIGGAAVRERVVLARLPAADTTRPNVLLLIMDTQRADHLSAYGYGRETTPHLDSLAASGVRFDLALSPAPTTLPSHATLMTGRTVAEHRAGGETRKFLDDRYPTLAESLREEGYATGGFVANIFWTGRHTGLNRGFVHYEDFYGRPGDALTRTWLGRWVTYHILPRYGMIQIPGRKSAADVNREFLGWVDRVQGRPFFAFLNYLDVHAPYLPPPGYAGRYASHDPEGKPRRIEIGAWSEHSRLPGPALIQLWRDRYDESLQYLDAQIGALLDSLRARGLTGRTLVIVTGDHGEAFGEHGMVHHGGGLYLEQVHVPLILSYPGVLSAGEVSEEPVGLAEIPSMIGSLAGVHGGVFDETPSPVPPGEALAAIVDSVPAVSEADAAPGSPASWQTGRGWVQSLVFDHWHLITMEDGDRELYDLDADPGEVNDLAALPALHDSITVLDSLLDEAIPDPEE